MKKLALIIVLIISLAAVPTQAQCRGFGGVGHPSFGGYGRGYPLYRGYGRAYPYRYPFPYPWYPYGFGWGWEYPYWLGWGYCGIIPDSEACLINADDREKVDAHRIRSYNPRIKRPNRATGVTTQYMQDSKGNWREIQVYQSPSGPKIIDVIPEKP